jgi:hypothetical protein
MSDKKIVCWFSAGITSTIATKVALDQYGKDNVDVIFFETGSHHSDNERYLKDCEEKIFGKKIEVVQNVKYKTVDQVVALGYINSPGGAYCTKLLKKDLRLKLEKERKWDHQIFGFEYDKKEINRAIRFKEQYPTTNPLFPLIDLKFDKTRCIEELKKYEVDLPMMYRLGYTNNNCVGCVKGGIGYWNKIRKDFPDVFEQMAKREREINATCLLELKNGKKTRLFLDTLDPERGRMEAPITSECGVICATEFTEIEHPMLESILSGEFSINNIA